MGKIKLTINTTELGARFIPVVLFEKDFNTLDEIKEYQPLKEYFKIFEGRLVSEGHIRSPFAKNSILVEQGDNVLGIIYSQYGVADYNMEGLFKNINEPKISDEQLHSLFTRDRLSGLSEKTKLIFNLKKC